MTRSGVSSTRVLYLLKAAKTINIDNIRAKSAGTRGVMDKIVKYLARVDILL